MKLATLSSDVSLAISSLLVVGGREDRELGDVFGTAES